MFFEVLSSTYHIPITIDALTYHTGFRYVWYYSNLVALPLPASSSLRVRQWQSDDVLGYKPCS